MSEAVLADTEAREALAGLMTQPGMAQPGGQAPVTPITHLAMSRPVP